MTRRPDRLGRLRRLDREAGSASLLAVGVVAGLVSVLVLALGLVAVLVAGQQARTAADLASLAAAGAAVQGAGTAQACTTAGEVAARHHSRLQSCAAEQAGGRTWPDVVVTVRTPVPPTPWTVTARARAGAVPPRPTPRRARAVPRPA
ncbi:hypothetical protein SGUI_1493 [Serinicoccus hydrothermalis]|uniref:Uncharacterized protein n=1 Tax=Serinicoccus hydrothermalis TaxID=1758689 RepID=A0A1B1NBR5_9MICO|nr:Rv3654c family TadE-like protein [Serinicoccus hydrothermalis]ANS78889.1 hypothetical protein SGUI_1493 [Serinicoccus hydrothermalis]